MTATFSLIPLKSWIYTQIPKMRKYKTNFSHLMMGSKAPRPDEIIMIQPHHIKGHLEHKNKGLQKLYWKTGCKGSTVLGGNWDKDYITYLELKNEEVYKSCHDHWVNGVPWSDTPLYNGYVQMLKSGIPNRFASQDELLNRYKKLDEIFESVKETQRLSEKPEDMIRISIARDGSLIWGPDGRHRICIAICAGLEKIPALVGYVHREALNHFQTLRKN